MNTRWIFKGVGGLLTNVINHILNKLFVQSLQFSPTMNSAQQLQTKKKSGTFHSLILFSFFGGILTHWYIFVFFIFLFVQSLQFSLTMNSAQQLQT